MVTIDRRSGFTWVELLVVIVIIGVLVALLLPATECARESARRVQCMNNQKQIALAMLNYEAKHGCFPGYVNRVGEDAKGATILGSWVVSLFPYMEQGKLWKEWSGGNRLCVHLGGLTCPSGWPVNEAKSSDTPLNYVVNCGRPGDKDTAAEGVFHNHDVDADPVLVNLDYISKHDGAAYTLMGSENLQAGFWADTEEANVGMVWLEKPERCSLINQCFDASNRPQDLQYARPSSRHPGGVIATFCDGHLQFLGDDIDYQVYQHLMTPDSQAAGVTGTFDPSQL
jgi:prepilin-type N-terminal cleavage/methylation domain-containing protein/prepilin-type processing-associated H-X9-DG protein